MTPAKMNTKMNTNMNINGEPVANSISRAAFVRAYRAARCCKHRSGIFAGLHCAATSGRGWWTHESPDRAAHAALHDRGQVDPLFVLGRTPAERLENIRSHEL